MGGAFACPILCGKIIIWSSEKQGNNSWPFVRVVVEFQTNDSPLRLQWTENRMFEVCIINSGDSMMIKDDSYER